MAGNPKVFCSHRWKDKPRVEDVARQLAAAGIDPWVDEWEIRPGEDFVASINRGLESCDAGLIFFSNEVEGGKWVQAEISALTVQAVEDGKPLIPVLLDADVPMPALLRSRSRLGGDQVEQLIDAIYGRTGKPTVAPRRVEVTDRVSGGKAFDVFLSHAHSDAAIVEKLAEALEDRAAMRVWLDKWILVPGKSWQREMARGLDESTTCAVCTGADTPTGWFREEIERSLNRQTTNDDFRVIPVILPGGDPKVLDPFLSLRTWIDFRTGLQDSRAFHDLVSGIAGARPGRIRKSERWESSEFTSIREKLKRIRDLRSDDLIDREVALEYQRTLLDVLVKRERLQ